MQRPTTQRSKRPRQPGAGDLRSYCRIIQKSETPVWDRIHKVSSAVVAVFIYVFYLAYFQRFDVHRYLTQWGVVITLVTRIYALLHYFGNFADGSKVTSGILAMQVLNFSIEFAIMVFYWAGLAFTDIPNMKNDGYQISRTVFNHLVCFILAALPVCLERNDFDQRYFYYLTLPFAIAYVIFMSIYVPVTGNPIYGLVSYKNGLTALFIIVGFVLLFVGFYLGFWINRCTERRWLRLHGRVEDQRPFRLCCWTFGNKLPERSQPDRPTETNQGRLEVRIELSRDPRQLEANRDC